MTLEIENRSSFIFKISIALFVIVHMFYINLPPCSIHVWRQCNTMSVARNFAEEDMNILHPRVDRRFESDGITGTAFPLYEWLLANFMRFIGNPNYLSRIFSLFISVIGIIFCYRFIGIISDNKSVAAFTASSICWAPEFFYHSMNALPDILALTLAFASLYYFEKGIKSNSISAFFISMLFLTLSGLVKIQYLMIGAYFATIFLMHLIKNSESILKKNKITIAVTGCLSIAITLGWYKYALLLIERSNLRDFGIEIRNADSIEAGLMILKKNLISDWPELVFGYANTLVIVIGIIAAFKKRNSKYFLPFLGLVIAYCAYHFLDLRQMQVHHYYMLPSYLFAVGLMAAGFQYLITKKKSAIILLVLIAQPILAGIRIIPARWGKQDLGIPQEFANQEQLNRLQKSIPEGELVIAGPDESGCIYLYFLHAKGFGFEHSGQLSEDINQESTLQNYIDRGASYLITSDDATINDEAVKKCIDKEVAVENNFHVFKLIPKKR